MVWEAWRRLHELEGSGGGGGLVDGGRSGMTVVKWVKVAGKRRGLEQESTPWITTA